VTEFWDRDGKPLPLLQWALLYEQPTYRLVARTAVASTLDASPTLQVSTVWIGFDQCIVPVSARLSGVPPAIYQTAALRALTPDAWEITETWLAATEAGARRTHDEAVMWACERVAAPVVQSVPVVPPRPHCGWTVR
jgi:hypothetical protein